MVLHEPRGHSRGLEWLFAPRHQQCARYDREDAKRAELVQSARLERSLLFFPEDCAWHGMSAILEKFTLLAGRHLVDLGLPRKRRRWIGTINAGARMWDVIT